MRHYYNDNDPKACAWLRELIAAGELPPGDVDERSITEIKADDLEKYDQCHFFAGIGGWPLALRWAGLENATGIWTGSCPCQPLSCAGKRQGHADERHLWPAFHALIAKCRPATVFGEQVASKDGREWFAGVRLDLEDLGYACGGADLCAAGVGAPHRRQRLYWVADTQHDGHDRQGRNETEQGGNRENNRLFIGGGGELCSSGRMADAARRQCQQFGGAQGHDVQRPADCGRLVQPNSRGWQKGRVAAETARHGSSAESAGRLGFWSDFDLILCRDGKVRRVPLEPALFPLAHGIPGHVGLLRGAGNAIVPTLAAEFVMAWIEAKAQRGGA